MSVGERKIYIIVSQTGTMLSRVLKHVTGAEYNHVSLSLHSDLREMYSFGRKNPYNPFWGGFVRESPHYGTFKRFSNTKVIVLELCIDTEKYEEIQSLLNRMLREKETYGYNYVGLGLAAFRINLHWERRYYCSEFVKEVLRSVGVQAVQTLPLITQPIHFLEIPGAKIVYGGKLRDYTC